MHLTKLHLPTIPTYTYLYLPIPTYYTRGLKESIVHAPHQVAPTYTYPLVVSVNRNGRQVGTYTYLRRCLSKQRMLLHFCLIDF